MSKRRNRNKGKNTQTPKSNTEVDLQEKETLLENEENSEDETQIIEKDEETTEADIQVKETDEEVNEAEEKKSSFLKQLLNTKVKLEDDDYDDELETTKGNPDDFKLTLKEKIVGASLIAIVIITVLVSAHITKNLDKGKGQKNGSKITADYLLSKIPTDIEYSDVNFNIDFQEDESQLEMISNVNIQTYNDIQHIKGNINTNIYGITGNVDTETWSDATNTYTYDADTKKWEVGLNTSGNIVIGDVISSINKDTFVSYQLEDVDAVETEYAVSGEITSDTFYGILSQLVSNNNSSVNYDLSSSNDALKGSKYTMMLVFDKETEDLTFVQITLDDTTLKFIIQINEISDKTLTIPDDIRNNADLSTEQAITEASENDAKRKTIAEEHFNTEFVDIETLYKETGSKEDIVVVIQTLINQYSEDEISLLASTWGKLDTDVKQGIAYLYSKGYISKSTLLDLGIEEDEIKANIPNFASPTDATSTDVD